MIRMPLKLPMMMYGKFRRRRAKRDENGNAIVIGRYKNGRPKYKMENYWLVHSEKNGDPGVYPSVNHIYTRIAHGRQKLTKPAEDLMKKWETYAMAWANETGWQMTEKEKVVIELTAYFPNDNKKRDVNNVFKLMMDALSGIIYDDDEYALPRVMDFHKVKKGEKPYFELNIYKKSEEEMIQKIRLKEIYDELARS